MRTGRPIFATLSVFLTTLLIILPTRNRGSETHIPASYSSELGLPFIENFSPDSYDAHGQNWTIIQDKNGFLYFGNTDGYILQYDGVSWRRIPIKNSSIVRSLAMDSSGTIYVGGQNEFGYLSPDSAGTLTYRSLLDFIDSSFHSFGNIWQIHTTQKYVYFNTRNYLFRMDPNRQFQVWEAETSFHSSFLLPKSGLYIHQMKSGLMHLVEDSLQLIPGGEIFADDWVYVMLPSLDQSIVIGTRLQGLFIYDEHNIREFKTSAHEWLIENQIYHGLRLHDNKFVLSTLRGGAAVLDSSWKISYVIDKKTGLLDNNIWFAFQDREGTLWFALNRGIAQVHFPDPFTFFDEKNGLEGNVQSIIRFNDRIYAATGMGVYKLHSSEDGLSPASFYLLSGLKSQCWALENVGGELLVSSNHGIFRIQEAAFQNLTRKSAWQMVRSSRDSNRLFLGLDDGISSLYKTREGWKDEGDLAHFQSEARTLCEDQNGNLWVGTVYEGVYRLEFSNADDRQPGITHFDTADGLPSMRYNLVADCTDRLLFGTTHGIYYFNEQTNHFEPVTINGQTSHYTTDTSSYTIVSTDPSCNLWFNSGHKPVFARRNGYAYNLEVKKYQHFPEGLIYTFYPEENGIVWIGGTRGIIRLDNFLAARYESDFNIFIRNVLVQGSVSLYGGYPISNYSAPVLNYNQNALRFEFAATSLLHPSSNNYEFILDGFDPFQSGWTPETKKDYTNIPEGSYEFIVRAKNVYDNISPITSFSFTILPPWYRTFWAYSGYFISFIFILIIFTKVIVKKAQDRAINEQKKIESIEKIAEEKLRRKVAADFHDELGNRITKISLFSEIIKSNSGKNYENMLVYLNKIDDNAHILYNETRDFIWHLDPKKDTLNDLIMRLKSFGDELFDGTDIHFEEPNLPNELNDLRLSMDWRQHILRIFKEALHNALKYSDCTQVELSVFKQNKECTIKLRDDGIGFDPSITTEGMGLASMQTRAKAISADLTINSKPGSGTNIELTLNLP